MAKNYGSGQYTATNIKISKIAAVIVMVLLSTFATAEDTDYSELAWHEFQAGRLCFEAHSGPVMQVQFEKCMKIQLSCKLIYDGIRLDKKREWITQTPSVKKYLVERGLKPLDYLHLLKLMSQDLSNVKPQ